MSYQMEMPKMGESITEGTIIKWHKKVGDMVNKDEIILEISTDKVDSEIPSPVSGKITSILANEGDIVEVGKVIADIDTSGIKEVEVPKKTVKDIPLKEKEEKPKIKEVPQIQKREPEKKSVRNYSPLVLNIARTEGISGEELDSIPGTGLQGRVTKNDVITFLQNRQVTTKSPEMAEPPSPGKIKDGIEIIPMDHIRKKIAEHMVKSVHTSPHVGLYQEINMQNIVSARGKNKNKFNQNEGFNLTYMPFIAETVVKTLKEFTLVNASIEEDKIIVKHYVNLGIAVATNQGLIVPVIKNAENLNLIGLARAINDLALRARSKKLKPDDVIGGTFSISNFGIYGSKIGFPIINQPQVAILGIGALEKRPVIINDAIAIRSMMDISLVFDHRIIDGALGAQFLKRMGELLEGYDPDTSL